MSDGGDNRDEERFVNSTKFYQNECKRNKRKGSSGEISTAKLTPDPSGRENRKQWYHIESIFEQFLKERVTRMETGFPDGTNKKDHEDHDDDQNLTFIKVETCNEEFTEEYSIKTSPIKTAPNKALTAATLPKKARIDLDVSEDSTNSSDSYPRTDSKDNHDDIDKKDHEEDHDDDQNLTFIKVETCNEEFTEEYSIKTSSIKTAPNKALTAAALPKKARIDLDISEDSTNSSDSYSRTESKDNQFREFKQLVACITNAHSYTEKTAIIVKLFTQGSDGEGFKGDILRWCRLLLPKLVQRIYNLESKQLINLFSEIFQVSQREMLKHCEKRDIGEAIQEFFERSKSFKPTKESTLTIQEVDDFLEELSKLTKENEQTKLFIAFVKKCTSNDLKTIIHLIKGDLQMNAGAKHILDGVHSEAYEAYQSSNELQFVIERCFNDSGTNSVKAKISPMIPVLPMLARACTSIEQAMKNCPNGIYAEMKYDGERVQVHKRGNKFEYYTSSLKPVQPHKVTHFKDYIPAAFPHGRDLILDSEILLIDTTDGKRLPFGSIKKPRKGQLKNASVCLFVFDCMYYNGEDLTNKPIKHRKEILKKVMTEIPNHIMFSEMELIQKPAHLALLISKMPKLGLEELILKDLQSTYEPGKHHWLKVKKDSLVGAVMADSIDLIVLGAWFGIGRYGRMMSIFLMGCYDTRREKFCTVTKVHTGHNDRTLECLQDELDMVRISGKATKVPDWLDCTKTMIPGFIARDPKKQPVWEITGTEFTQDDVHTAYGISIKFPVVTKIRDDKTWEMATNLEELKGIFDRSKSNSDIGKYLQLNYLDAGNSDNNGEKRTNKKQTLDSELEDEDGTSKESRNSKRPQCTLP